MIDIDMLLKASRKPWYCRSEAEENMLSPEFIAGASARIEQAEKDAARYRWLRDSEISAVGGVAIEMDKKIDEAMQCNGDNK
ncbi:MAG: hypothetical protein ACRDC4_07545 [Plesiomonas sp.]